MRNFIKQIPLIGSTARWVKRKLYPTETFTNSQEYWVNRYQNGGNSGSGSYNNLAEYKGEVINNFVSTHPVKTVIDLGFGDGNQLEYFQFESYLGFDVSDIQVHTLSQKYSNNPHIQFKHVRDISNQKADMVMSLDVIYHLTEDDVYENYMKQLFDMSTQYVIIYSQDSDDTGEFGSHIKLRKFSSWIAKNKPNFKLIQHIPNKYPYDKSNPDSTSISDFYMYQKQD